VASETVEINQCEAAELSAMPIPSAEKPDSQQIIISHAYTVIFLVIWTEYKSI